IGVMQAVPTFLVLWLMGVDAPVLWAVLVFLFSFIPTIGTIFGIVFPVLMTALQFAAWEPVVIVLACLGTVQLVCTNLILPKMMSQSLNLSPLVVMVAVFGGAAIWGIVGALIAVPALTMALIICMQKSSLNYVAVLLSANGELASDRDQWPSAGQEP
ncbi:MAG: AI-2E family transporter, partial [Pseudomonadota bacterium]